MEDGEYYETSSLMDTDIPSTFRRSYGLDGFAHEPLKTLSKHDKQARGLAQLSWPELEGFPSREHREAPDRSHRNIYPLPRRRLSSRRFIDSYRPERLYTPRRPADKDLPEKPADDALSGVMADLDIRPEERREGGRNRGNYNRKRRFRGISS